MFMNGSEPWSCKPDYVRFRAPVIYLPSFEGSAINPKPPGWLSPTGPPQAGGDGPPQASYLILLRMGFALRRSLRIHTVVSYTTFSPLPDLRKDQAVYFLWHFP